MNYGIYVDEFDSIDNPFDAVNLTLDKFYISAGNKTSIIIGILCFLCFALAVAFVKKGRGLGVTAAILQFVGIFSAHKSVVAFSNIDFSNLFVTATGSSYDEAYGNLQDEVMEAYMEFLPQLFKYSFWGILMTVSVVFSLVYVIKLMKCKGKALAICALIFVIFRFVLPPVQIMALFNEGSDVAMQSSWDWIYRIVYVLPAVFVAIVGLLNIKSQSEPQVADVPSVVTLADVEALSSEENNSTDEAPAESVETNDTPAVETEQVNVNE